MTAVQALGIGDHKFVGQVIGESFADDPVNLWIFGNQAGIRSFFGRAAKKLYLRKGYGHRVGDDGCTLWLGPNVAKKIPLWNSIDIAFTMARYSGPGSLRRGLSVDSALESRHPREPHYYLFAIGTRPSSQGRGIGRRLMTAGLERADKECLPAYLESSKESNVPFYRHYGFEVIDRCIPGKGCPPLWLMWREPRSQ